VLQEEDPDERAVVYAVVVPAGSMNWREAILVENPW